MAAPSPILAAERFVDFQVISVSVLDDMRLIIEPVEIARAAEHNAATFRIVRQPANLDGYVCRAEVKNSQGTNYRLVVAGEFSLTADIAVQGIGELQLVYSDGADIIRKTYAARFHVSQSINAVDESDPEYQNGLAQLQAAAFAQVQSPGSAGDPATFYNVSGQPVGIMHFPPGQGGGIDEAQADLLYVRQDGRTGMTGDLRMVAAAGIDAPIGVYIGGRQASIMWANALQLRRGQAGEPVQVADVNGGNPSEVVTRALGDALYVTPAQVETTYARLAGAQFTGPLITQTGNSNTNLGVSIGDNSTGLWRTSTYLICVMGAQTVWQSNTIEMLFGVRINAATQPIWNLGDPRDGTAGAADAVNRRYVDAAVAAVPRPAVPAARTYIPNEVTIGAGPAQEFFNQPFFTNDNQPRTILVTVYPQFADGTPSAFYDLEYTTGLSVGLIERSTVYPTAQGYMGGGQAIAFAATVTPVSSQIAVSLSVRQMSANPGALTQIGSRATQRSYVVIQEMTN